MTLRAVTQNTSLDPIAIEELADLMAKQAWVDMRVVPGGIAERVLVVALLIRREEEEVQIEQWLQDESGEIERNLQWVHAEEIWWAKPTQFERGDELKPFRPTGKLQSRDNAFDAAIEAVGQWHGITAEEVAAISRARLDEKHLRYWVMLVWVELTGKPSKEATALFGYGSVQPYVSAQNTHRTRPGDPGEHRLADMVRIAKGLMP